MPAPTEALIQVKPQQLCYRHPMEPNKNLASSLELKNLTNDHVAYMFVVSGEVEYSSARAKGIISPSSTWEVVFNMKAQNMSVLQHKNKVILRSTIVSKDLNPDDITLEMFKRTGRIVDEVKLDFVMEAPAPSQPPIQEKAGEQQPHEVADHFKMLDVQPLELHFHFQRGKLVPCSFQLTNIKGEYVAFRLMEKSGESECFVQLPLQGILPPGSTHTLIVRTNMLQEQQQKRDCDLILQTCVLGYFDKDWLPFENESGCENFFNLVKMWGGIVHEVAMKASQEKSSEILSSETTPGILYCFDTNPIKKWIITGYPSGSVDIVNYEKQMAVNSLQVSYKAVCVVKFIARKQYFVAGSFDGFLHVYDYGGTKLPNKKKSWEACDRSITSLAIHPTEPYVLSSGGNTIKLWNWEVGWKCEQTFKGHYDLVRQLVFNPSNTNIFASASDDKTIKVWKLYSSFPEYTLDGHSREATCLDFFSSGYHQYLISGSNDKTAKIWDLQKKICVQTLDAFISSVTCVTAHPNLPMLITGSEDGILHIWKSTDFSLERVLNIGSGGYVRGIGFFTRSRIVIGQSDAISELSIDTMNYHEASLYLVDDETDQEETAPGDIAYEVLCTPGLYSFDANEVKHWIITADLYGYVRIWNYHTQKPVDSVKVSMKGVQHTKFISRKQWFLAATSDGFICVYNYENKNLVARFKASDDSFITSVAVHPTKPYVLSSAMDEPIKLWNWEECREGCWKCVQTFEGHTSEVNQITFNPMDTNTFASAFKDGTIKVWSFSSRYPKYTLSGRSGKVHSIDYFTRGDQLFLISGAHDGMAKIWDLQEKKCVQTLEASFSYPVTSVCSHPTLPVLITGLDDGSASLWSSTDFRLQRMINIPPQYGGVIGFGCLSGSKRILTGQKNAVSVVTLENMELEEAKSVGDTTYGEKKSAPSKLLDIEPLQLHFPSVPGKLMPCSLKLTNKTDEQVAFWLTEKNQSGSPLANLPLYGVVLPGSTYTLVVTTKMQEEPAQDLYSDLILQSSALEYQNIYPFVEDSEYDRFFSEVEKAGKAVQEVTIRAVYGDQQGKATTEGTTSGIKILYVEDLSDEDSVDVHPTDPWIVIGDRDGHVRILDSEMQALVASMEDKMEEAVTCVRFIARKKWIVAGSSDGSIYVYSYENNKMQNIERINADTPCSIITSLAVHPTLPLVLSTAMGSPIKLWNWENQWECTQEFEDDTQVFEDEDECFYNAFQVVFNPVDTNSFACVSGDLVVKFVQVRNLDKPSSVCTLEGYSDGYSEYASLDYFACDNKQYLIAGSNNGTAKIWDLETKVCVQPLDVFAGAVTSVRSYPSLPLLITGSRNGVVHFWNSTTFRLEKVLNFGSGCVLDLRCSEDSRRIVIRQEWRLYVIELDEEHVASEDQS